MPDQPRPPGPARWIQRASDTILGFERLLLGALMLLLTLLVLLNVATRYSGVPIYWIDEASVYTMVWLAFIGASVMTRLRLDFAVGLLTDKLSARGARIARICATSGVLVFGCAMLAMCWLWMDPPGIIRYGFDAREYAAESFNFLYTERTQTLGWPTWLLQSVLPIFSFGLSLHALANLMEDLALVPRRAYPEFPVTTPEMVN